METKNQNQKLEERLIVFTLLLLCLTLSSIFVMATPTGPSSINITANETGTTTAAEMVNISGGYISTINITASTQNPHWKAFVGWIDGKFTLDDSSGSTIYDWTLSTVSGEVYATRESTAVEWTTVNCANETHITTEDTALEHTGEDDINATFSGNNSNTFVVAGTTIAAQNCSAINTYVDNESQTSTFEEAILYDSTGSDLIFATILEEDEDGFDENDYDFQMIVPENGNETFAGATAYYLYVELS